MSSSDREVILADFQACTGIDDVGESIMCLEEANWNLLEAVNRIMPQEIQELPSSMPVTGRPTIEEARGTSVNRDVEIILDSSPASVICPLPMSVSVGDDISTLPSTSRSMRALNFNVEWENRSIPLTVQEEETVGTIKSILHAETGIPPCGQELIGWDSSFVCDNTRLSSLNLPKDNNLILLTSTERTEENIVLSEAETVFRDRLTQNFKLNISDTTNNREFSLNYPGTKIIQQIREDIFSLTDIPVRHQQWTGWPDGSHINGATLASSGVGYPCHKLTVSRRDQGTVADRVSAKPVLFVNLAGDERSGSSSGGDEFEDANETFGVDDELFTQEITSRRMRPLMPDNVTDELEAVHRFITEFRNRYGNDCVAFFAGTLEDALKEAFQKPVKERRLMAVYLHHDGSILANVFCAQLLCSETVASYLAANFVTWCWDLTRPLNRDRFLAAVERHFGALAAATVRDFPLDRMPVLLVIGRTRSTTEVTTVVHGNVGLDELLTRLIQAVEVFSEQRRLEVMEEEQREAREQVKREQDEAYEASLLADRAKEEARRLGEEKKIKEDKAQRMKAEREELMRMEEEAARKAIRVSLENHLPDEPPETYSVDSMSRLRIRLPTGEVISRRFLASDELQVLLDFLTVKGFPQEDYKVLTSWPRKDLTLMDPRDTLEQLALCPQETLTLEAR